MVNDFKNSGMFSALQKNVENDAKSILNQIAIDEKSIGVFFKGDKIIFSASLNDFKLPLAETVERLSLSVIDLHVDSNVYVISCETESGNEIILPDDYYVCNVKKALLQIKPDDHHQILKSYHWLNWSKQSKYCGECGKQLEVMIDSTEKKCLSCNKSFFPRFSPAVMVLIYNDDKILLARSPHFPPGDYSAIAGFIDCGETAEQAAHREVKEELGIEIDDLKFFSTQTWPFPDSFMIAFTARYSGGELRINTDEIEDACWFGKDDLPELTPSVSIARKLINSFVRGHAMMSFPL